MSQYKIQRNEKRPPKEAFFSIPPILPETPKGSIRFCIESMPTQTGKAYLINIYGVEYWLPKSQVKVGLNHNRVYVADIPEWLIKANKIPI